MSIVQRIREVIGPMTQPELAALLNEKPHRVNAILCGKQRVPEDFLVKFVEAFHVDGTWLLTGRKTSDTLTPREAALLDNYRHCPEDAQRSIETTSALLAQRGGGAGVKTAG